MILNRFSSTNSETDSNEFAGREFAGNSNSNFNSNLTESAGRGFASSNHTNEILDPIIFESIHDISGDLASLQAIPQARTMLLSRIIKLELHLTKLPIDITEEDVLHYINLILLSKRVSRTQKILSFTY